MKKILFILSLFALNACKNESRSNITTPSPNPAKDSIAQQNNPTVATANTNGIPIYNGFINADTTNIAAGNKYVVEVLRYELYNKYLYLDKNYEIVATDQPNNIRLEDLGAYHPYLLRVFVLPKPDGWENVQAISITFTENGIPYTQRTDFLAARLDGWNQQLSSEKNFRACNEVNLECKAKQVLKTAVEMMFR